MAILLSNRLLEAAEEKIESNLTPENRANYTRIVVAGMKVLLRNGPNGILAKLKGRKDPVSDCAIGAVNLVLILRKESHGIMPFKATVPAAMTLMLKGLDFADKIGAVKITNAELDRATHIFTNTLMARFKITSQMLQTATQRVHGLMQDPQKMEMIKRKAGVVIAPQASHATPMPEE